MSRPLFFFFRVFIFVSKYLRVVIHQSRGMVPPRPRPTQRNVGDSEGTGECEWIHQCRESLS